MLNHNKRGRLSHLPFSLIVADFFIHSQSSEKCACRQYLNFCLNNNGFEIAFIFRKIIWELAFFFASFYLTAQTILTWSFVVKMFTKTIANTTHNYKYHRTYQNVKKLNFSNFSSRLIQRISLCMIKIIIFKRVPLCAEPERQITKRWRHKSLNSREIHWCTVPFVTSIQFNCWANHVYVTHSHICTNFGIYVLYSMLISMPSTIMLYVFAKSVINYGCD